MSMTKQDVELQLQDAIDRLNSNHPNSNAYKAAASKIDELNQVLESWVDDEEPAQEEPVDLTPKEADATVGGQCTLQQCLEMERKQMELAEKEAAEKAKGE